MKRIVILCDGTWNEPSRKNPTNVVRIAQLMEPVDSVGIAQIPIYVGGVGLGEGVTTISRVTDKYLGGALGWGLYGNVIDAYRHIVFAYQPGDQLYIFGFSRGAFTARSLAGFIRATGVIPRDRLHLLPEAVERYQKKGFKSTHPSSDESHAFRLRLSPGIATSAKEQAWRKAQGEDPGDLLKIDFLGVWDSVGALGIPRFIPLIGGINRKKYQFHDAALSSIVASARHTVALDERRRAYEPTRWENLEALNAEAAASGIKGTPYQELFFAGDHGAVGGTGEIRDLSSITLEWIVEGAQAAGLEFDAKRVAEVKAQMNPVGPLRATRDPEGPLAQAVARFIPHWRAGPEHFSQTHPSVYTRWSFEAKDAAFEPYRPGSLKRIEPEILAYHNEVTGMGGDTRLA